MANLFKALRCAVLSLTPIPLLTEGCWNLQLALIKEPLNMWLYFCVCFLVCIPSVLVEINTSLSTGFSDSHQLTILIYSCSKRGSVFSLQALPSAHQPCRWVAVAQNQAIDQRGCVTSIMPTLQTQQPTQPVVIRLPSQHVCTQEMMDGRESPP